jgi:hypothetical protein
MGKPHDITKQTFGRLTALDVSHRDESHSYWRCVCACGNETVQTLNNLRRGKVVSCGCFQAEAMSDRVTTHGKSNTTEYGIWAAMKRRCMNPNVIEWPNYGGRGIAVCERWLKFENFFADMGPRPAGLTLERRDTNGGYEPGNCYWANRITQANNTRANRAITVNGRKFGYAEACAHFGVPMTTVASRISRGWEPSRWFIPKGTRKQA